MGNSKDLICNEAVSIGLKALSLLEESGKTANIVVVNRSGYVLFQVSMDGAIPQTAEIAGNKAKQASHAGRRTRYMRDKSADPDNPYSNKIIGIDDSLFVRWAGGVPIFDKDKNHLGALGISNMSEDDDEYYGIRAVESCGFLSDRPE